MYVHYTSLIGLIVGLYKCGKYLIISKYIIIINYVKKRETIINFYEVFIRINLFTQQRLYTFIIITFKTVL